MDWRLAIDFIDSQDIILQFDSAESAHAKMEEFLGQGVVSEQVDGRDWYYPIAQVRSFSIYHRS